MKKRNKKYNQNNQNKSDSITEDGAITVKTIRKCNLPLETLKWLESKTNFKFT